MGICFKMKNPYPRQTGEGKGLDKVYQVEDGLGYLKSSPTLLFEEAGCDPFSQPYFTLRDLTARALEKKLISPANGEAFQKRALSLFTERMSPDGLIDTKTEIRTLGEMEIDFILEHLSPFVEGSGRAETWAKAPVETLRFLEEMVLFNFSQDQATENQSRKLKELKRNLHWEALANEEVQGRLRQIEGWYQGNGRTLLTGLLAASVKLRWNPDQQQALSEALLVTLKNYPDEMTPPFLITVFGNLETFGSESPLTLFLLGSETEPPSPLFRDKFVQWVKETKKETEEGSDFNPYGDFSNSNVLDLGLLLGAAFRAGHPDAFQIADRLLNNASENNFIFRGALRHVIRSLTGSLPPPLSDYSKENFELMKKKWERDLPRLYRSFTPAAPVILNEVLTYKGDRDIELYRRLEFLRKEELQKQGKKYREPDFRNIAEYIAAQDERSKTEGTTSSSVLDLGFLFKEGEMPAAGDALEAVINESKATRWMYAAFGELKPVIEEGRRRAEEIFSGGRIPGAEEVERNKLFTQNFESFPGGDPDVGLWRRKKKKKEPEYPEWMVEKVERFFDSGIEVAHAVEKIRTASIFDENNTFLEDLFDVVGDENSSKEYRNAFEIIKGTAREWGFRQRLAMDMLTNLASVGRYRNEPVAALAAIASQGDSAALPFLKKVGRIFFQSLKAGEISDDQKTFFLDQMILLAETENEENEITLKVAEYLVRQLADFREGEWRERLKSRLLSLDLSAIVKYWNHGDPSSSWRQERAGRVLFHLIQLGHEGAFELLRDRYVKEQRTEEHLLLLQLLSDESPFAHRILEAGFQVAETALAPNGMLGLELIKEGAKKDLPESWGYLLDLALHSDSLSPLAAEVILEESYGLSSEQIDAILTLDRVWADRIGLPSTPDEDLDPQWMQYSRKIFDLMGETELGKAVNRFYDKKRELEKKEALLKQLLAPEGKNVAEEFSEAEVEKRETWESEEAMGNDAGGGASFTGSVERGTNGQEPAHGSLKVSVIDSARRGPVPSGSSSEFSFVSPAVYGNAVLVPGASREGMLYSLRLLIRLAEEIPPYPGAFAALSELIEDAAALARLGETEGWRLLEIIRDEAGPFWSGQAENALDFLNL